MSMAYVTQSFGGTSHAIGFNPEQWGNLPQPVIPEEIILAARKISQWADTNGYEFWQIQGVCDRRYALPYYELIERIRLGTLRITYVDPSREPASGDPSKP